MALTTELSSGSHQLTIVGYSSIEGIGISTYVKSKTFFIGGYEWYLRFYPDGRNAEDKGEYISIFLRLGNTTDHVKAQFEITLLDSNGKSSASTRKNKPPRIFKQSSSPTFGFDKFIKKSDIEALGFGREDILTFKCTVFVMKESESVQPFSSPSSSSSSSTMIVNSLPTHTSSVLEFQNDLHHHTVRGYSSSRGIGTGMPIRLANFTILEHTWYLEYYPDGYLDDGEYLSFYLTLVDAIDDVKVLFKIVLLDSDGEPSTTTPRTNKPTLFGSTRNNRGHSKFMKKLDFESSKFLMNDGFTVECRIVTIKEPKALLGTSST